MVNRKDINELSEMRKPAYQAPRLSRFGSVRKLTGGSIGTMGDGGSGMTRM